MGLREVDPFLAPAGGNVVRIEVQDLLIFLEGEIVTPGVVVAVRVDQQLLHILDLGDELRAHRPVEIAGLGKMGEEVKRLAAIRIVAIAHDFPHHLFSLAVFAFGNALLGQFHSTFAEAVDRAIVVIGGRQAIGQKADGHPEFIMGLGKILRLQREPAAGERALPLQNSRLPFRDFAFGDAAHILRGGGRPGRQRPLRGEEKEKNERRIAAQFGGHERMPAKKVAAIARLRLDGTDLNLLVRLLGVDDDGFVGLDVQQLIFDLLPGFQ